MTSFSKREIIPALPGFYVIEFCTDSGEFFCITPIIAWRISWDYNEKTGGECCYSEPVTANSDGTDNYQYILYPNGSCSHVACQEFDNINELKAYVLNKTKKEA